MTVQYRSLLQLEIRHPYYNNGIARDMTLTPTASTLPLMRRYHLLLRTTDAGFVLLYGATPGTAPALQHTAAGEVLRFVLKTDNPWFLNFTDTPDALLRRYWRAQNAGGSLQEISADTYALTDDPLRTALLREEVPLACVGALEIPMELLRQPADTPLRWTLSFEARKTWWRYLLVNRSDLPMERLEIRDGARNETIPFSKEPARALENGQQAQPLILLHADIQDAARPSAERHLLKPKLRFFVPEGLMEREVTLSLPTPDYKMIRAETNGADTRVFSDMYVYFFKPNFF
jgi:hypothetical protein